jgi:hypothetical protein
VACQEHQFLLLPPLLLLLLLLLWAGAAVTWLHAACAADLQGPLVVPACSMSAMMFQLV